VPAFAYRTIKTAQATVEQQQTVTRALDKLADATIGNLKHGQKANVDSAIKFARILIEATPKVLSEKLKLLVSPTKVMLETAAVLREGKERAQVGVLDPKRASITVNGRAAILQCWQVRSLPGPIRLG
jgi:hypothetical protein